MTTNRVELVGPGRLAAPTVGSDRYNQGAPFVTPSNPCDAVR